MPELALAGPVTLRWTVQTPWAWQARSGDLVVGFIVCRASDQRFVWQIQAVDMGRIAHGDGDAASFRTARRAVERGWQKWLNRANLTEKRPG